MSWSVECFSPPTRRLVAEALGSSVSRLMHFRSINPAINSNGTLKKLIFASLSYTELPILLSGTDQPRWAFLTPSIFILPGDFPKRLIFDGLICPCARSLLRSRCYRAASKYARSTSERVSRNRNAGMGRFYKVQF